MMLEWELMNDWFLGRICFRRVSPVRVQMDILLDRSQAASRAKSRAAPSFDRDLFLEYPGAADRLEFPLAGCQLPEKAPVTLGWYQLVIDIPLYVGPEGSGQLDHLLSPG